MEKILDEKVVNGKTEYLVQWKLMSLSTWEPANSLNERDIKKYQRERKEKSENVVVIEEENKEQDLTVGVEEVEIVEEKKEKRKPKRKQEETIIEEEIEREEKKKKKEEEVEEKVEVKLEEVKTESVKVNDDSDYKTIQFTEKAEFQDLQNPYITGIKTFGESDVSNIHLQVKFPNEKIKGIIKFSLFCEVHPLVVIRWMLDRIVIEHRTK